MKLNEIQLHNFGSYEGTNSISFSSDDASKRVTIIGGKNGAGKTTLFTAIQVCLYGHYAFGYKSASKRYLSEIFTLINNKARLSENGTCFIKTDFQQVDDTDIFDYSVKRVWTWNSDSINEQVIVIQNGVTLSEDEVLNFQNYLIHLIPPEMLKLYFFDGEKIADYFLEKKEVNIRDALMILSGNDTFDILYENVKRVLKLSEAGDSDAAQKYLDAKITVEKTAAALSLIKQEADSLETEIDETKAELQKAESAYAARGGITLAQWKEYNDRLKEEEEKRERLNWQKKALATDTLPFLILPSLITKLSSQLSDEKAFHAYEVLKQSVDSDGFSGILSSSLEEIGQGGSGNVEHLRRRIRDYLLDGKWENFIPLFGISNDEEAQIQVVLSRVHNTDLSVFKKYQKRINASIQQSKEIREILQNSDVEHFEEYIKTTTALKEKERALNAQYSSAFSRIEILSEELAAAESKLRNEKKAFEEQLKRDSITALSGRVLLLLEDLQTILYKALIEHVQHDLNEKFRQLIRKKDFFTEIIIDPDFTVHILRQDYVPISDIVSLIKGNSFALAKSVLGATAMNSLMERYNPKTPADLKAKLERAGEASILLPIEIDKDHLSSGEKQIFVMSLYWAMMNQSSNDLPFIIDTPFARIDTEHRANITEHFFRNLSGELVILSTDEELSNSHLKAMSDQIAHVYMLEYTEDKRTSIQSGKYFEV